MSLLSRLLGTHKKEKQLIKSLKLFNIALLMQLIEDGDIDESNHFNWLELLKEEIGYLNNKLAVTWLSQKEISTNAAIAGFQMIKNRKPINTSELLKTLLLSEATILAREIYSNSLGSLEVEIDKTFLNVSQGKFSI